MKIENTTQAIELLKASIDEDYVKDATLKAMRVPGSYDGEIADEYLVEISWDGSEPVVAKLYDTPDDFPFVDFEIFETSFDEMMS